MFFNYTNMRRYNEWNTCSGHPSVNSRSNFSTSTENCLPSDFSSLPLEIQLQCIQKAEPIIPNLLSYLSSVIASGENVPKPTLVLCLQSISQCIREGKIEVENLGTDQRFIALVQTIIDNIRDFEGRYLPAIIYALVEIGLGIGVHVGATAKLELVDALIRFVAQNKSGIY